jgi:hypothetical protein
VTIVMPAIPPKGAKNQLRRETGVPAPYPSSAEWMEKGRTGVGPIVAAVSRRHSNESRLFSSPGRPGQTMTPLTGRAAFSLTLRLSQWFEIHKPPVDSSRPVSANSGHCATALRTGRIDAIGLSGVFSQARIPDAERRRRVHHVYLAPNAPRTPFRFSLSEAPTANS